MKSKSSGKELLDFLVRTVERLEAPPGFARQVVQQLVYQRQEPPLALMIDWLSRRLVPVLTSTAVVVSFVSILLVNGSGASGYSSLLLEPEITSTQIEPEEVFDSLADLEEDGVEHTR